MQTKEDVLFEVYGRTISPSKEMLRSMDGFVEAFGAWLDEQKSLSRDIWSDTSIWGKPGAFKKLAKKFLSEQSIAEHASR